MVRFVVAITFYYYLCRRMSYSDAIEWLKADGYKKEDGTFYEFGEVWFRSVLYSLCC